MKNFITSIFIFGILFISCKADSTEKNNVLYWKLGWRMIENSILENHHLSSEQFDSLRAISNDIPYNFMTVGLRSMSEIGNVETINKLLQSLDSKTKIRLCENEYLKDQKGCKYVVKPDVENRILQGRLLKMFSMDQSVRGNIMDDLIRRYQLDTIEYNFSCNTDIDLNNQCILKEAIKEYGFPSIGLIGKDALRGVFMIIQHADQDTEWQKEQLPHIKSIVLKGELDATKYAYLYDRIQMNAKLPQLYGTQFSNVNANEAILYNVHDEKELDLRRMEIGLMPIATYKRLMLFNISQ